ncbi:hypothetical protein GVN18_43065, partial [Pseudomonas sp. ODNR1LW]|nr:hypothetical protein [Pseudomonas sp. ODNR1LW]
MKPWLNNHLAPPIRDLRAIVSASLRLRPMGKPSKLSDAEWEALFDREARGERRADLAREQGVSVSTLGWQAKKRGRMKGQTPDAVDHRRRPAEGWPADHVFVQSRSGMTPARWRELLARRNAGETDAALGAEYG